MAPETDTPKDANPSLVIRLPETEPSAPINLDPEQLRIFAAMAQTKQLLEANPTSEKYKENWEKVRKDALAHNIHLPTETPNIS